jgi:hypothetical protein
VYEVGLYAFTFLLEQFMSPLTFRLTCATIALFPEADRQVARALPQGSVIVAKKIDGDKLVEVIREGKTVLMFAQDIRSRGERVTAA